MSVKKTKKDNAKKNPKVKSEELMDYLDTEKLEEKLLGDIDTLENVGYILGNISSADEELQKISSKVMKDKKDKKVKVKKNNPGKEIVDELDETFWETNEDLEGELSLDVYDDGDSLIIQAPVAGVNLDDIEINYSQGVLTIKGERKNEKTVKAENYLTSECYWGKFSRSVFLPVEINTKKIKAHLKNGILMIILPKLDLPANVDVEVKKA